MTDLCNELSVTDDDFFLSESKWNELKEVRDVLEKPKIMNTKLQGEQLTLSDAYAYWIETKLHLQRISHLKLAKELIATMNSREFSIIGDPLFKCCIFLDARYQNLLNAEEKTTAITKIVEIWNKATERQQSAQSTQPANPEELNTTDSRDGEEEDESLLIHLMRNNATVSQSTPRVAERNIRIVLESFSGVPPPSNRQFLNFGRKTKINFPKFTKLLVCLTLYRQPKYPLNVRSLRFRSSTMIFAPI